MGNTLTWEEKARAKESESVATCKRLKNVELKLWRDHCHSLIDDEGIMFLYAKFQNALHYRNGEKKENVMTRECFEMYMRSAGAYKLWNRKPSLLADSGVSGEDPRHQASKIVSCTPELDHLFRAFDVDRNGLISFSDFLTFHVDVGFNAQEHLPAILFHAYDADGDGFITLRDIFTVISFSSGCVGDLDLNNREVVSVIQQEALRLMAFLDIHRTGRVTEGLFRCVVQRYPEVMEKLKYLM